MASLPAASPNPARPAYGLLVFSPPTFLSHSNRVSILTSRGFASPEIETVAETGDNGPLVALANKLRARGHAKTVMGLSAPIMPAGKVSVMLRVDCINPFISFISMIAPSPDWIVFIDNMSTLNRHGRFINHASGRLIAYDAGVDSGGDFTPPGDASLDIPTVPPKNIAPLVEDSTDVFRRKQVGFYRITRIRGD